MPKKKTEHQKRLYSRRKVKLQREMRFRPQPFSFLDFFKTFQMGILLAAAIISLVVVIPRWDRFKKTGEGLNAAVPTISEEQKQELSQRFPHGFKLIEMENWTMKPLDDSLSKDFQLNWNNIKLKRMDSQMIRIALPEVLYKPAGISLTHAVIDLQRRHQEIARFSQGSGVDLLAQMISDDGQKVICLFSFQAAQK